MNLHSAKTTSEFSHELEKQLIKQRNTLRKVYSLEDEVTPEDFDQLSQIFKQQDEPSFFEQEAKKLGISKHGFNKAQAQAVFVSMATHCKSTNLECFDRYSFLIRTHDTLASDYKKNIAFLRKKLEKTKNKKNKKLAKAEIRKTQKKISQLSAPVFSHYSDKRNKQIQSSEIPFLTSISLAPAGIFEKKQMINSLSDQNGNTFNKTYNQLSYRHWGLRTYLDRIEEGVWINKDEQPFSSPLMQECLAKDFTISNLSDRKLPDKTIVQLVEPNGKIRAFETHQIVDVKGLRCIAYTPLFNSANATLDIKVVFCGTTDLSSSLLDAQKHSPGERSFIKSEQHILSQLDLFINDLHTKTGKKINIDILGHSLGGALAQHLHAAVSMSCAIQQGFTEQDFSQLAQNPEFFKSTKEQNAASLTLKKYFPLYLEKAADKKNFQYVNEINLTTKFGAKGSHRDNFLSKTSMHLLKDKNVSANNLILRHTNDWVHKAGEWQSMTDSPDVNTRLVKINTMSKSWVERHNASFIDKGNNKDNSLSLEIMYQSKNHTPEENRQFEREVHKGHAILKSGVAGSSIEKAISKVRGQKAEYKPIAPPSPPLRRAPYLFLNQKSNTENTPLHKQDHIEQEKEKKFNIKEDLTRKPPKNLK